MLCQSMRGRLIIYRFDDDGIIMLKLSTLVTLDILHCTALPWKLCSWFLTSIKLIDHISAQRSDDAFCKLSLITSLYW